MQTQFGMTVCRELLWDADAEKVINHGDAASEKEHDAAAPKLHTRSDGGKRFPGAANAPNARPTAKGGGDAVCAGCAVG